ncbi:hypothetical protein BGW38_008821, partial [Lunasporangiospora selenospora]
SLLSHGIELDEDTDVVQLIAEPSISLVEKAQALSQSQFDFHRSFLAREVSTLLPQMRTYLAIIHIIPIVRDFSLDQADVVREALASQLEKIVLYFLQFQSAPPPPLPHDVFSSLFMNLLLDQNPDIAHQARLAVGTVADNVTDDILESEILGGVIAGLRKLYESEIDEFRIQQNGLVSAIDVDRDGEADLGKMLVVV